MSFSAFLILPVTLFAGCKSIEEFECDIQVTEETKKICTILESSKKTLNFNLKILNLLLWYTDDSEILSDFFDSLADIGLKLEKFGIRAHNWPGFSSLYNFFKSQANLIELEICTDFEFEYVYNIKAALPELKKLKSLEIWFEINEFNGHRNFHESQCWKFPSSLEEIQVGGSCGNLSAFFFEFPSDNLKSITLYGGGKWDCADGVFEKIANNYRFLTTLHINKSSNYSSNDIFFFLKYLKKLQNLTFYLPENSPLDSTQFDEMESLKLPDIQNATLGFNEFVTNDLVLKFMLLMSNVLAFCIFPCAITNDQTYDIISRELRNLNYLRIFESTSFFPTTNALNIIAINIEKYNSHPGQFDSSNIRFWTEKLERNVPALLRLI